MRIFYDNVIFSLQRAGGISVYWYELAKRLAQVDDAVTFYGLDKSNLFARELSIQSHRESRLPVQILRCVPFLKRLPGGSLFHSSYYRISLQKSVKNVVTVHDFTAERFVSKACRSLNILQKRLALRYADGIICVSQNTKDDLLALYPEVKAPIVVIHHGVSEVFRPLPSGAELVSTFRALQGKKLVLFVGTRDGYKNFPLAVEALALLEDNSQLVLIGGGSLSQEEAELLTRALPGRHHHYLGLSEAELNILYNNAHCLLYPSSYEGFGLPVLESMRAGCPVVALRASSIPEVAGGAALLAEAPQAAEFAAKVKSLDDPAFRSEQVKKGLQRAQQFTWDRCFEKTYEFYGSLVSRG